MSDQVTAPLSPRQVTLVLCDAGGVLLGSLPPFEVPFPFWQEVGDVVDQARARFGAEVVVLRLLQGTPIPDGPTASGPVTYLAQLDPDVPGPARPAVQHLPLTAVDPGSRALAQSREPLRLSYALPGGPQADLAWADAALLADGTPRTGPAHQQRTWNLSSIWRLPTARGPAWLKVVPPFFGHEGAVIELLHAGRHAVTPEPIAVDGPRVLLRNASGTDLYGATGEVLHTMVRALVALQADWVPRTSELVALGLPDWRGEAFVAAAQHVLQQNTGQLDPPTRAGVESLVEQLPRRLAELAGCGLPDTLVHGDFHPGNVRAATDSTTDSDLVILDWGDCGIGDPLFDESAFLAGLGDGDAAAVRSTWSRAWREAAPGCDPDRAAGLIEPLSALRRATVYQGFLDRIEPTERVYHAADPRQWLAEAASVVSRGPARP